MEIGTHPKVNGPDTSSHLGMKRSWTRRSRRGMSQRVYSTTARRSIKVVKLGGGAASKKWRVASPKLRLISPVTLWSKFKNAYMSIMLRLGSDGDHAKRIPKVRQNQPKMSNLEFDNRLIYEIYKSLSVSMELHNP